MTAGITVVLDIWNPFPGNDRPTFAVVGSCKQLGWWNPNKCLVAQPIDEDKRMWRTSVLVPRWYETIEFQWIVLHPISRKVIKWEQCPVRVIPLRQNTERVSCWFESKATIVKVLPVNRLENDDWKKRNFQKCVDDIGIYMIHDLNVDIKFEYYTPDENNNNGDLYPERDILSKITDKTERTVKMNRQFDSNCKQATEFPKAPCQISRVGGDIVANMMSPGGAAAEGVRQEVGNGHVSSWRKIFSLKGALTTGLLVGAAVAAGRFIKSLST